MIVVDASAALAGLLNAGPARQAIGSQQIHVPHLIDSEIAHALRRRVASNEIAAADGWTVLDAWRRLGATRYAAVGLLDRIWELRENVSAYDATYVAARRATRLLPPHRRRTTESRAAARMPHHDRSSLNLVPAAPGRTKLLRRGASGPWRRRRPCPGDRAGCT